MLSSELGAAVQLKGRILSRHLVPNTMGGADIHIYIQTDTGPVRAELSHVDLVCFCAEQHAAKIKTIPGCQSVTVKPVALQSFNHEPVAAIYCKNSQTHRSLMRGAIDLGIALFESEVRPEHRFLIERFIAMDIEVIGQRMANIDTTARVQVNRARKTDIAINLSVVSLDFECAMDGELYSVALYGQDRHGNELKHIIMVDPDSLMSSNDHGEQSLANAMRQQVEQVASEHLLIEALIRWFNHYDPDVIIGWAVVTFDLALLFRRARALNIPLIIGRAGSELSWKVADKFRPETLVLPGRVVLDGIDWLKAAFYQFDSYSLESVSQKLLGEGKAITNVTSRAGEINTMFSEDKWSLAHYNLTDCRLVWDIFKHTDLLEFALERARMTGLELGRVGASVAAFNNLYLPHLHRAGYVAPSEPASDGIESPGGYVMDSIPGLYRNIIVLDFKSLYPSIIRTFLIDPKGLVEAAKGQQSNTVAGFLGAEFSRNAPILPELIKELTDKRELAKRDGNNPLSQAIKIIMNSLYGVLGSRGCVFHDAKLASSITLRGHQIMQQTKAWIEEAGYQVIYGDTDSTFVWIEQESDPEKIASIASRLVEQVNNRWQQKLSEEFQLPSFLELEFEQHYQQFLMPTLRGSELGSKKRYVGAYIDSDGELQINFKGMEQVRSDWSPLAKEVQLALYQRLFSQQDPVDYLKQVAQSLFAGDLEDKLVFSKRLRRNAEDYTAMAVRHVKAAMLAYEASGEQRYLKKGTKIDYVITTQGAQPLQYITSPINYDYYLDKQIKPIADPVLSILKLNFSELTSNQMSLI
ncbi:DNA polymerase II [Shewanella waksmanii]|uniref:DNA polymerase II n=1 Tax=Shewanella waksmanii TaxID=213783 RepID=UPI003736B0EB